MSEVDQQYERIIDILDPNAENREDSPPVNANTLNVYFHYLLPRIRPGLLMTGNDTCGYFSWEERFFFGFGDEALHKKMRRTKASSEDKFKFMELLEGDEPTGLIAKVKRVNDNLSIICFISVLNLPISILFFHVLRPRLIGRTRNRPA